jgi:hypothetical protein
MTTFKVIEERGCDIEYQVFEGTVEACLAFVDEQEELIDEQFSLPHYERTMMSGADSSQPFTYRIEEA